MSERTKREWLTSLEGWNFDALAKNVHKWRREGNKNLYVSDLVTYGALYFQLVKSYDRIVGLIDKYDNKPILFKLGNWSKTTSKQLSYLAGKYNYMMLSVELMSQEAIDVLQGGL